MKLEKNGGLNWDNFDSNIEKDDEKEEPKESPIATEVRAELKNEKVIKEEKKPQEIKLGNTIISSDTRESDYDVNDLLKAEAESKTLKIDSTKLFSANSSKTEIVDSLKKIEKQNNRETVVLNTQEVKSESDSIKNELVENKENVDEDLENVVNTENIVEETNDTLTKRIIEQKVKSDMDDTQFIDTGKVREELFKEKNEKEDDIPMTKDFENMYKKVFGTEVSTVRKTKEEENAKLDISSNIQFVEDIKNETIFKDDVKEKKPKVQYRYIGAIFGNYAIIEVKDEMYMIEKSAAEERLMYEVVKNNFYDEENKDSVTLLLADIITLNPKEMSIARGLVQMFKKAGFEYDEFGEYTLKLMKVPSWAEQLNTKNLFLEILREMDTVAVTATEEKEEKFIATVASKYVEFSDTSLDEKELEKLVRKLLELESPFMYPNGRLTAVKISKANMEKKFSRR